MQKYADLLATIGTWTSEDGKTHKRRVRCGVVMRDSTSGKLSIRIELMPVSPEWSGWLAVVQDDDVAD